MRGWLTVDGYFPAVGVVPSRNGGSPGEPLAGPSDSKRMGGLELRTPILVISGGQKCNCVE